MLVQETDAAVIHPHRFEKPIPVLQAPVKHVYGRVFRRYQLAVQPYLLKRSAITLIISENIHQGPSLVKRFIKIIGRIRIKDNPPADGKDNL